MPQTLHVILPKGFIAEREYALGVMLQEFLCIAPKFVVDAASDCYKLRLNEGPVLHIADAFFGNFAESNGYLQAQNIPQQISWLKHDLVPYPLPILFGTSTVQQKGADWFLGADLVACSFFMLSRWEEFVNTENDEHQRFPTQEALAVKQGFHHLPVVDGYCSFLQQVLLQMGWEGPLGMQKEETMISHDIDIPLRWPKFINFAKELAGDLLKRKSLRVACNTAIGYAQHRLFGYKDPYDQCDAFMDIAEAHGKKAYFFFMSGGKHALDYYYDIHAPNITALMQRISKRGHHLGFHPSYNSFNNAELWNAELDELVLAAGQAVRYGRQHYLRFAVPYTWRLWDRAGMEWDSSLGFNDELGYRCGTGRAFTVFDCKMRKKLRLKEKPLVVMDVAMERSTLKLDAIKNEGIMLLLHNTATKERVRLLSGLL